MSHFDCVVPKHFCKAVERGRLGGEEPLRGGRSDGDTWKAHVPRAKLNLQRCGLGVCGLLALAAATPAPAQTLTEKAFFEELPVVLSASRIPQSLSATPGAVTVLDREFIRATGYRDIQSLLKLVPGFQVVTERGGLTHVTYHGLGGGFANRMQVLIDGRSVYSPYFLGGVDWFAVPLTIDEIERIEVLRGSNSATYGSNAFMGVVNIVTQPVGDRTGGELSAGIGSNELGDLGASYQLRNGPFGLRFNAEVRYDHGLPSLVDSPRKGVATLRADYQLNARDDLTFWAGLNDARRGNGYDGNPVNSNGLRAQRTQNSFVHVQWRRVWGPDEEIKLGYYHNEEHGREEHSAYLPPLFPVVPIDYNRTSDRDNLDFQHLFSPSATTRLAWGVELRRDAIRSPRVFFGSGGASQSLARAFANLEWRPLSALTLNAGLMVERYSGKRARLAPRLFVNWQPVAGHTLRLGRSIAYRAPSLFEEQSDMRFYSNGYSGALLQLSWLGDPAIKPERIRADEIGYVGQFRTWSGVFDLRMFREKITDLVEDVVIPPLPGVLIPRTFSVVNSSVPVLNSGYDWHYSARPTPRTRLSLAQSNLKVYAPFANSVHQNEAPRHTTTATWMQDWDARWFTTLSLVRYESFEWSASLQVPGYAYLDARLAYRFGERARPNELALVLFNVGEKHQDFSTSAGSTDGRPVWRPLPRLIFLTLKVPI